MFQKLLFFLFSLPFILFSQYQNIKFEHITVEDGLSNNKLRCIVQDQHGFIWIGTHDGLNKYDGYKFTVYRNDPADSLSLSSNWITYLFVDKSGDLWISTMGGGLNKFNYEKDNFTRCNKDLDKPRKWKGLSAITMKQIAEYHYADEKVLWIGTFTGLHKLNFETLNFTHFPHTTQGQPYCHVQTVTVDKSGMVWIGSLKGGVHKFNPETEQFTHYQNEPDNPNSLSDNRVFTLHFDRNEILWIGTAAGGLNRFEPDNETFKSYQHDPNDLLSISSNNVVSIVEDHAGVLWVGTVDGGLNIFNRDKQEFTRFIHDPGNPTTLNDNTIWHIYEDNSDILWLGTWGGVNKVVPNQFFEYKKIPGNTNSLNDSYAGPVHISTRGESEILWIGTRKGLNKIDRNTGEYIHYAPDPDNEKSNQSMVTNSIFEDKRGIIWIGTYGNGLFKFDPLTEQFSQYTRDQDNPYSISDNMVHSIFEDRYGLLWIGTDVGGINLLDREKETFTQIGNKQSAMHIIEDHSGELWIATWPGLRKYDRETGKFINYYRNRESQNYPELNRNNFILEPQHGDKNILWIGSYSGLNKFDLKTEKFTNFTMKDGLPSNVINGMLEDEQGNLWLSTNNGLSKFDPKKESFRNYDVNDGLLSNKFSFGGCCKSKDDEMFFSSSNGVNAFYPDKLVDNLHTPNTVITDFQLFNKSVGVKTENESGVTGTYFLNQHISLTKEINLSYLDNVLSLEFSSLDFYSPKKNRYRYKMEKVDPDWVHTDASRRFATYTHLAPGSYTFKVLGSNNDGLWDNHGTSINIHIAPPWWKTSWAYSAYIFLFALTLYALRTYDKKRQHLKHELELEHLHAAKLEEVDQMKSQFFANVSHEFRTPLTLILGPVKQMLSGDFAGNIRDQYQLIIRNGERLLQLINQLLDLSKLESGKISLQIMKTDLGDFIKDLVCSFTPLAETKKITLRFNPADEILSGYIDRDKIEKIVINLLSNAFKFTPEKGIISVAVKNPNAKIQMSNEFPIPNSKFQITISNTGPGIPPDKQDKIFDRFYQTNSTYKKDSEGTGIGLALTKELVDIHHGNITVNCTGKAPDTKTIFSVLIPIGEDQYKPEEIVYETETGGWSEQSRDPGLSGRQQTAEEFITNVRENQDIRNQMPVDAKRKSRLDGDIEYPISNIQKLTSSIQDPASRILLVEDNPDVTTYICSFLNHDYQIVTAINGKDGWDKTLDKYPDLVISDVMMPEMDGFELCKKIKSDENTSHIPVILLTAKADLNSRVEGLEYGADDYISKPFEARELQVRVKNLIEQRQRLKENFSRAIEIKPAEIAATSMDEQFITRLMDIFEDHVAESGFSTEDFAREIGMSRSNLHRKLQALTNQPTHEFLRTLRLKRAAQLLHKSTGTVAEVAYAVGFNNLSHFTKIFREHFGQTPRQYASKNQ